MTVEPDVLTELRITVARLDERMNTVINKLDEAVTSRDEFEQRLGPLTEHMNRWKGALMVITFVAGGIGATVSTFIKDWLGASP